jgi:hypothetical protein
VHCLENKRYYSICVKKYLGEFKKNVRIIQKPDFSACVDFLHAKIGTMKLMQVYGTFNLPPYTSDDFAYSAYRTEDKTHLDES